MSVSAVFENNDLANYLFEFLKNDDFLNGSATQASLRNHDKTQSRVDSIKRETFLDEYGAIADCEKNVPIEDLGLRTQQIQKLFNEKIVVSKRLPSDVRKEMKKDINRDVGVLDFDENGYPTLLDKIPSNLNDNSAWYEKIAENYKIWREGTF
ncbi:MAG: hypothetical protein H0T62_10005 [Parachlamydiaceae bacterium]|nr:hypothetical protein [Parachlamydiaceae bacterium]